MSMVIRRRGFRPLLIIIPVVLLPALIGQWAQWRQNNVIVPRYCGQQRETLDQLRHLISIKTPIEDGSRRAYMIAAKLLFIQPQQANESTDEYLLRLRDYLEENC